MEKFKIAAVQMNALKEDLDHNLDVHIRFIEEVAKAECRLVMFPELSATAHYGDEKVLQFAEEADGPISQTVYDQAKKHLDERDVPLVVKADGLAAGKGVYVCKTVKEAEKALDEIMVQQRFGEAGDRVIIEDCLIGEEASYIVFTDGQTIISCPSSQDHKAVFDGDTGANTGGMGAYSPAPVVTPEIERKIMDRVIKPTVDGMATDGRPYKGILYAGLMIDHGQINVLEYNCRMGDPEAQPILMLLKSDIYDLLSKMAEGKLDQAKPVWRD